MQSNLQHLQQTWEELGREDPLWAVVSHPNKRGGRWDLAEFMKTGEEAIAHYDRLIETHARHRGPFAHVLDFGCGVGRLTRAWGRRSHRVTGVDISAAMLEMARNHLTMEAHVDFVLNQSEDLQIFQSETFDLVFSLICLQHMPWPFAARYIGEFARVCRPGGLMAFQLPSLRPPANWKARLRKTVIDRLPFGAGRFYRRWRHGSAVAFDTYYTPAEVVEQRVVSTGLRLVHREPDPAAGPGTEGFFYIFRKPQ